MKVPLGGEDTKQNPTDKFKIGTKRSLLVEGNGVPVSLVFDGANVQDIVLAEDTLVGVVAKHLKPAVGPVWDFEVYKGYDSLEVRFLATHMSMFLVYHAIDATHSKLKNKSKISCQSTV
jgi:putative transposase